jgi:alpha-L-rhamnosidase
MKRGYCLLLIFLFPGTICFAQISIKNMRCENRVNPVGLDILNPRFSWQMVSDRRNEMQTGFEVRVGEKNRKEIIWNSGKQLSAQSVFVPYSGKALQSAVSYFWQVRVWDNNGKVSEWSKKAFWQMGLSQAADWKAKWIESESAADSVNGPAILFRKQFTAGRKPVSATVFITAHGMYEAFMNGKRIGDSYLTPGWTSYSKRLQYQVYDVSELIKNGANAIGVSIGSGWYRTPLAWNNNKNLYGKKVALLLQLEIKYTDGTHETIITDGSWKTSDEGPIRSSEIYNGEVYDARMEKEGWNQSGYRISSGKMLSKIILQKII